MILILDKFPIAAFTARPRLLCLAWMKLLTADYTLAAYVLVASTLPVLGLTFNPNASKASTPRAVRQMLRSELSLLYGSVGPHRNESLQNGLIAPGWLPLVFSWRTLSVGWPLSHS